MMGKSIPLNNGLRKERIFVVTGCSWYLDEVEGMHVSCHSNRVINNITCKATRTLGFLRRNLTLAPKENKVDAYRALVHPKFEYAAPIWNPHNQTEIDRIEKVQRTAARWACRRWRNESHVGEMLEELRSNID